MIVFRERRIVVILWLVAALYAAAVVAGLAIAQKTPPRPPDRVAIGESEVKQLLLLMDTDKNGKISKKEYMDFMEKEFERLDQDKSGELDVKELTQSRIRSSPPAIGK
jgi:hypothetical protein